MSKTKGAVQVTEAAGHGEVCGLFTGAPAADNGKDGIGTAAQECGSHRHLMQDVSEISLAVKELDAQFRQLLRINQALESDLTQARKRIKDMTDEREALIRSIDKMEQETVLVDDMQAEVTQAQRERDTLARKIQDLGAALSASEQRVGEIVRLLDKFRAERDGASEEALCLDAQFSRAMKVINELRTELDERGQREEKLKARLRYLKNQLHKVENQRDSYKVDLVETREALQEIRASILDASCGSQPSRKASGNSNNCQQ